MNSYEYIAKDKDSHTVTGVFDAASEGEAAEFLHKKELVIISIKLLKGKAAKQSKGGGGGVKSEDMVIFSRQLATMIDSGIPLAQALGILAEQIESKGLKAVVVKVHEDIQAGTNFCDSLSKHPKVFSDLFINMVRAGETAGMLDEVLDRLAAYLEKSEALARKISSSMVYPILVISMSFLITAVLLLKVVPTFKGIFDMLGGSLPLPTRILIGLSDFLRGYFLLFCGIIFALSMLFKRYIATQKGHYNFDAVTLKLPVIGDLFCKVAVAKFSRTFSTLIKSGVAVLNALEIVSKTAGNKVIEQTLLNCRIAVREGESISRPLSKSGVFPMMVCRMISIGEQTGQLEKMLTKIADFYDDQVDAAVSGLTSMIEPLVIAFLGVIIGGIVISLFLPIFKITELLSK